MFKYILKRLLYMVVVWIILSIIMFIIYTAVPNNRAYSEAKADIQGNQAYKLLPKEEREKAFDDLYEDLQYKYGTETNNQVVLYLRWIGLYPYKDRVVDPATGEVTIKTGKCNGMLQGNFGYSFEFRKDVIDVVKAPMRVTILINIFATILALAITIPLGIVCAVHKGSHGDKAMQVFTIIGYSLPVFLIAIVAVWLFCWILGWFPATGLTTPASGFTGARLFADKLYHLALPLIVMTFCSLGGMTRYVRASMIEALSMDCVRTARAKGVKERTVIYSHAWRNALIPVITLVVGWFLGIFSGSVMIEQIFGLNGMGNLLISSLTLRDFDIVLFLQMFYVSLSLLGNLIIDLAYGLADPRVRVNK